MSSALSCRHCADSGELPSFDERYPDRRHPCPYCPPVWRCEQHPDTEWPHDDCAGPGMLVFPPHEHAYDERGFCTTCRMTPEEASRVAT